MNISRLDPNDRIAERERGWCPNKGYTRNEAHAVGEQERQEVVEGEKSKDASVGRKRTKEKSKRVKKEIRYHEELANFSPTSPMPAGQDLDGVIKLND